MISNNLFCDVKCIIYLSINYYCSYGKYSKWLIRYLFFFGNS